MDVCYTKVERRRKDKCGRGRRGYDEKMEWDKQGAEEEFFVGRPGDEVAPAYPAAEGFVDIVAFDPVAPAGVDDASFEEGAGEEEGCKEEGLQCVERRDGVPAEVVKDGGGVEVAAG